MILARHESIPRQTRSQDGSMDNIKGVSGNSDGRNISAQNEAIIGGVVGGVAFIASELTLCTAYLVLISHC